MKGFCHHQCCVAELVPLPLSRAGLDIFDFSPQVELTKAMVMEKPTPLLVGWKFVRQHYAPVNQALDMLHRFYGKNSSHVHGGLDSNGKPADAVYRQKEIHRKVVSQNFTNCHTKILHVDAYAMLNDGVVVQVMVLLSNNNQALRRFMQMFVLAPEGSIAYQFYVHNDIFRHQDGFVTEPQEESEEEVEEPEERQQSPLILELSMIRQLSVMTWKNI